MDLSQVLYTEHGRELTWQTRASLSWEAALPA